ncbi:hypothetical protein KA071_02030 [Candidatus Gracilibacteria bacterium]|nr:hypothetical protein [Candidatus Gracilibacteria bacterium]
MIDFRDEIDELRECKGEFDFIGQRLFDLSPDTPEAEFSTREMFSLSAQIIYTRKRVADTISEIQEKLQEDGMSEDESGEIMEVLFQDFSRDDSMLGTLVEDIAALKNNELALSFIARYEDMLLSVLGYCENGDKTLIQKKFKDVTPHDMGAQ